MTTEAELLNLKRGAETNASKYCGKHLHMVGQKVYHIGLKRFISKTPQQALASSIKWMTGVLPREEMDPLVILLLELRAHADRVAVQRLNLRQGARIGRTCPLCAVVRLTGDESQDVKSLFGYGQVVLRLFQSNGLVSAADGLAEVPEPKTFKIERPKIAVAH